MSLVEYALHQLHQQLEHIARHRQVTAFDRLLHGEDLPALGNDHTAAERILQALEQDDGLPRRLLKALAELVGQLLHREAEALELRLAQLEACLLNGTNGQAALPPGEALHQDSYFLSNLFRIAAFMPREENVYSGLLRFHGLQGRAFVAWRGAWQALPWQQLRPALAWQQRDAQLKGYWLGLLRDTGSDRWTPERRTELIESWGGLLSLSVPECGEPDYALIDEGLRLLAATLENYPDRFLPLLKLALVRMRDALGVAAGQGRFIANLKPYWVRWPENLQDVAAFVWPQLDPQGLGESGELPLALQTLWQALPEDRRQALEACRAASDVGSGRREIDMLVFEPPCIPGQSPQAVRSQLNELKNLWFPDQVERDMAALVRAETRVAVKTENQTKTVSRREALESVSRAMDEIARRLARGDVERARKYLDELIAQQRVQGFADASVHIAKTLSRAATLARNHGHLAWARELQQQSITEHANDVVSANGLADVLKAQGDLPGAAAQYRDNMARWPNDVVSANGLADVLKAQSDLPGAAAQYRDNMARWPNEAVARHGLASVLRLQGSLVEALSLLPEWGEMEGATSQRLFNQHLRSIILADLGRITEARAALERGAQAARVPSYQERFIGGLGYLALRERDFERVFATVAQETKVFSLQVLRAHALAATHRVAEAQSALGELRQAVHGTAQRELAVSRLDQGFAISQGCTKDASSAELQEIFDCEIELLLAA